MAVDGKWRVIPGGPVFLGCKKLDLASVSWESDEFHTSDVYSFLGYIHHRFRHKSFFLFSSKRACSSSSSIKNESNNYYYRPRMLFCRERGCERKEYLIK